MTFSRQFALRWLMLITRIDRRAEGSNGEKGPGEGGFTLIEVMISIVIAAAAMIAIATLLVLSNRNMSKSRISTSAVSLAQGLADSMRSTRPQDLAASPWVLTSLTASGTFLNDPTNPNQYFTRTYRVDAPMDPLVDSGDLIQVTVRVTPIRAGAVTGKVYGSGGTGRTTDLIFYMRDPNVAFIGGGAGIVP